MAIFVRPWLYWVPAALPFLGLGRTTFPTRIRLRRLSGLQAGLLRSWRFRLAESNRGRAETAAYFMRRAAVSIRERRSASVAAAADRRGDARERRGSTSPLKNAAWARASPIRRRSTRFPRCGPPSPVSAFRRPGRLSERLLTLPTHHWLSEQGQARDRGIVPRSVQPHDSRCRLLVRR